MAYGYGGRGFQYGRPSRRKQIADAVKARSRDQRREEALGRLEGAGSAELSSAKTKGALGSAVGGMVGGKLGSMALGGLLAGVTGGIINPATLSMLTTGASALGSGAGAGFGSRLAMGKSDVGNVKGIDEFADLRDSQGTLNTELGDQYNAMALKHGINAAKGAALKGGAKYTGQMGAGSPYATSNTPFDYNSLKGSGLSQFDYDKRVFDAQKAWKAGGMEDYWDSGW